MAETQRPALWARLAEVRRTRDNFGYAWPMTWMDCLPSMESMADHDAVALLQAEDFRLIALLESHAIDWRATPKEHAYQRRAVRFDRSPGFAASRQ